MFPPKLDLSDHQVSLVEQVREAQTLRSDYISVSSLDGFDDFVHLLGGDPVNLLKRAGINPDVLDKPKEVISITSYRSALTIAAEALASPAFGLRMSQRQSVENLGPVGYLMRHAPNLRAALRQTTRHLKTHNSGNHVYLLDDGEKAFWCIQLIKIGDESCAQQAEFAVGLTLRFIRSVISSSWAPDGIYFEHKAPKDLNYYQPICRCPVNFGHPITALEFPSKLLDRELKTSDSGLYDVLEAHLERLSSEIPDGFVSQVRHSIQLQFELGQPRLSDTAESLGISVHVLQRRLKREGTTFKSLLQEVRFRLAQRYLKDTDLSLVEISSVLGLSEPAVFTRTFQKQAGISPSIWRKQHRVKTRGSK